ncbi:MAG: hypothetical protein ABI921_00575 [Panacibacter sp.]
MSPLQQLNLTEKDFDLIIEGLENLPEKEMEQKIIILKEDIKILQGKLLMLKRHLMQEGALSTTYDILNHIK